MDNKKKLRDFVAKRKSEVLVLVTIVATEGSTYKKKGAVKVISTQGESAGIISGGCLERDIVLLAKEMKNDHLNYSFDTTSPADRLLGYSVGCEGVVHLKFHKMTGQDILSSGVLDQKVKDKIFVYTIGLGLDIDPLRELLIWTGWEVRYYTNNIDQLSERKRQGWSNVHTLDYDHFKKHIVAPERSAVLLMSHNYPTDLEVLKSSLELEIEYIGILGPKQKKWQMIKDLKSIYDIDLDDKKKECLYGPVGVPGLGKGEMNVALATITHIQKVFTNDR